VFRIDDKNVFCREARSYFALEMEKLLRDKGFDKQRWRWTLSKPLDEIRKIESVREGPGNGGFVLVLGTQ